MLIKILGDKNRERKKKTNRWDALVNEKCIDVNSVDLNARALYVWIEGLDCIRAQSPPDPQMLAFPWSSAITDFFFGIANLDQTLRMEGQCYKNLLSWATILFPRFLQNCILHCPPVTFLRRTRRLMLILRRHRYAPSGSGIRWPLEAQILV